MDEDEIWHASDARHFSFEWKRLVLLSLRNIAPGIWQPIFSYGPERPKAKRLRKASTKPRAPVRRPIMFIQSKEQNLI